jgi:hypothetical protein
MEISERKRLEEILLRFKEGIPIEEEILTSNYIEALRLLYMHTKGNQISYGEFVYLFNKLKEKKVE